MSPGLYSVPQVCVNPMTTLSRMFFVEMLQELLNTVLEEDSEAGIVRLQEKANAVKSPVLREVLNDIAHILRILL